uniref:Sugar phosphate transporter domain-containing protein n=1 Tax=Tetraselmis sp. GSL018 TaxID=582737 RepID=A0A061RYX6_9CHLO
MGTEDKKLVQDTAAFALNVISSVAIIFVNKELMGASGYGFKFATTLCALHFATCAAGVRLGALLGLSQPSSKPHNLPPTQLALFVIMASCSIASLNISLMLNTVGLYQIAKLIIVPCTCFLEAIVFKSAQFTAGMLISVSIVLLGIGIVTVTDVALNPHGIAWAVVSILTSSLQQVFCGHLQRKFKISSHELLSLSSPFQALFLLVVGPFLDKLVARMWVHEFEFNVPAVIFLVTSCVTAILVNLSQYFCLGRFSAVTFQVLGHLKTVLVLLGGWLVLHEPYTGKQLLGCSLAVLGMCTYGYLSSKGSPATGG